MEAYKNQVPIWSPFDYSGSTNSSSGPWNPFPSPNGTNFCCCCISDHIHQMLSQYSYAHYPYPTSYYEHLPTNNNDSSNSTQDSSKPEVDTKVIEDLDDSVQDEPGVENQYELSEEIAMMFAKTEARRRERKRAKDIERREEIQELKHPKIDLVTKTVEKRKTREEVMTLKRKREVLYGSKYQMKQIEEFEATFDSLYDHLVEMKQPRFWPTVALNK